MEGSLFEGGAYWRIYGKCSMPTEMFQRVAPQAAENVLENFGVPIEEDVSLAVFAFVHRDVFSFSTIIFNCSSSCHSVYFSTETINYIPVF